MKGLIVAIQFMTRLPTPNISVSAEEFAASIRWFPMVGIIVGGCVAFSAWLGAHIDPWLGALLALASWIGVTGALHLDGLGDIADANGAAHKGIDKERLRAILADPHIGSFGTIAIVMQLLAKLVLLFLAVSQGLFIPLLLTPFATRIGPLFWAHFMPPLHRGLGATFSHSIHVWHLVTWLVVFLAAASLISPALLVVLPLFAVWAYYLTSRFGGISGDGHGAGIEITETCALLTLITVHIL